ncbi:MAG: hypothetical protein U1E60_06640 [Reyranellaceae bacterium]
MPEKHGRPATGKDPMVGARFPPSLTASVDAWAAKADGDIQGAEAIRRVVELGLQAKGKGRTDR